MWERSWADEAGVVVGIEWNPGVETTTDTHAMFADTSWGDWDRYLSLSRLQNLFRPRHLSRSKYRWCPTTEV